MLKYMGRKWHQRMPELGSCGEVKGHDRIEFVKAGSCGEVKGQKRA